MKAARKTSRQRAAAAVELANAALVSPHIAPEMVTWVKRSRYNPIRQLTPEYLSRIIDTWNNGFLREFSLMADAIKHRDPIIQTALGKREKAVSRYGFEVLLADGLDEAEKEQALAHQKALKYFYDNLTVTHVLEQDIRGGFRLLVRQMMEAQGMRYSAHEIIWQPTIDKRTNQPRLTATFNFVPVWFFEATTGKLRFVSKYFGTIMGEDMNDGDWLVTVGEGLMEALSVCFMLKTFSLKDWAAFSEKFGMPGILGKTTASKDSPAWTAMVEAVESFGQEWSAVCNTEGSIDLVKAEGGSGSLPFSPLVEYMDKVIPALCRGADLSTISSGSHGSGGQGRGASLQGEESSLLEEDDAEHISETLQEISRQVIEQLFGDDRPLAYLTIVIPEKKDTDDVIKRLTFLASSGVPVGQEYARRELGVPPPAEGEETLKVSMAAAAMPPETPAELANAATPDREEIFRNQALSKLSRAQAEALKPLTDRLQEIMGIEDEPAFDAALLKLQREMPAMLKRMGADKALISTWEDILGTALASSAIEATKTQKSNS
jgi:phage gp29-like protein